MQPALTMFPTMKALSLSLHPAVFIHTTQQNLFKILQSVMGGLGAVVVVVLLSLSLTASADGTVSIHWNLRQDFEYRTPCLSWAIPHLGRHIYHGEKCKFWGSDCSTHWPVHYLYLSPLSIPTTPPFPKNHTVEFWPANNQGDSPCLSLEIKRQRCDEVTEQQRWVKN